MSKIKAKKIMTVHNFYKQKKKIRYNISLLLKPVFYIS